MDNIQIESIMGLVRFGLGKVNICSLSNPDKWQELYYNAQKQGIAAILLDGINKCFERGFKIDIDFQTKMEWIGLVQQMERQYQQYEKDVKDLGAFYSEHGIRMMVLKGYGLAQNYPIPSHRPCGDVDIYLFGDQENADKLLQEK